MTPQHGSNSYCHYLVREGYYSHVTSLYPICFVTDMWYSPLPCGILVNLTIYMYIFLYPTDVKKYEFTPRLFELSSITQQFLATEVLHPCRSSDVLAFPFLQSDLYHASQPGELSSHYTDTACTRARAHTNFDAASSGIVGS